MSDHARHDVSAFFDSAPDVDVALDQLVELGVPRDLIDVAVSPAANKERLGGKARRVGSQIPRFAAIGALVGLLLAMALSLEIILVFPGFEPPARELSVAQLLGPNVGMMVGAIVGALVGAFAPKRRHGALDRVDQDSGILLVVRAQPEQLDAAIRAALDTARGRDVVVAPAYVRPKRRWFA